MTYNYSHRHRLPFSRHIRDRRHVPETRYVNLKFSFQSRFVETWESTARIRRLKLSRSNPSIMQKADAFGKQSIGVCLNLCKPNKQPQQDYSKDNHSLYSLIKTLCDNKLEYKTILEIKEFNKIIFLFLFL